MSKNKKVVKQETSENPAEEIQPTGDEPAAAEPQSEEVPTVAAADPFSEVSSALADAKPEVQPHFDEATKQKRQSRKDAEAVEESGGDWRNLKDKSGKYWHPDICTATVDPDSNIPKKTPSGLWKLKRGMKSSDRKRLPDQPPNIDAKLENAAAAAEEQQAAEIAAADLQARSIMFVATTMTAYKALWSKISGPKAVDDVMGFQIGEGQYKISVSQMIEASGIEMMMKRGGGPSVPPELLFLGGLSAASAAMYFHPSCPERKATFGEKVGILWRRITKRNGDQGAKKEDLKPEVTP